jgi:hypothetical protein
MAIGTTKDLYSIIGTTNKVFVNKINNLATQNWKKILAFAS